MSDYPKFVYQLDGSARLLATAQDAATLPEGLWFEDPEGREPFAVAAEPAVPVDAPEPEPPAPAKPRSHKKAAKD